MKRAILLFSACLLLVFSACADNFLLLKNSKTGETNVFRKGSFIVFELKKDGTVREGYIREIKDSSLSFEDLLFEAQVSLSEINVLAGTTKSKVAAGRVANAIGSTMLVVGGTVFDCGIDIMLHNDYYYWPLGGTVWLAGAMIAGLGHAFDWALCPGERGLMRVRNYRQWEASIINEKTQFNNTQTTVHPSTPGQPQPATSEPEKGKKEKKKKPNAQDDDVYGD